MLPFETRLALFPRDRITVRLGAFRRLSLHPVTLERAAAMEMMDCGLLNGSLNSSQALMAAWLLSMDRAGVAQAVRGDVHKGIRFVRRLKGHVSKVAHAVNALLGESMAPFVPPKSEGKSVAVDDGLPHGFGWPLEIAEALCAMYGWSFDAALQTEVQRALALLAVGRKRRGGEMGGPDYYDRIRIERLERAGIIPSKREGVKNG